MPYPSHTLCPLRPPSGVLSLAGRPLPFGLRLEVPSLWATKGSPLPCFRISTSRLPTQVPQAFPPLPTRSAARLTSSAGLSRDLTSPDCPEAAAFSLWASAEPSPCRAEGPASPATGRDVSPAHRGVTRLAPVHGGGTRRPRRVSMCVISSSASQEGLSRQMNAIGSQHQPCECHGIFTPAACVPGGPPPSFLSVGGWSPRWSEGGLWGHCLPGRGSPPGPGHHGACSCHTSVSPAQASEASLSPFLPSFVLMSAGLTSSVKVRRSLFAS